jgi:hypothetical protein
MYLKQLYVENNGPLAHVHLELPFTPEGMPKPVVLVGGNGSGKTNLLSIIADALIIAAQAHYGNVLHGMSPTHKPWFRVIGSRTIRVGTPASFTVMQFEHEGATYLFSEKGGHLPAAEARARLPESLQPAAEWRDEDSVKRFGIAKEQASKIFESGVYAYFPSSRAEAPHWLNTETVAPAEFDLRPRFAERLSQPIYIEKALERLQQWILSIILESRLDFRWNLQDPLQPQPQLTPNAPHTFATRHIWELTNKILRQILGDPKARFVWMGRTNSEKLGFVTSSGTVPSLGGLSAGQGTLLGIFGTILSYGDQRGFAHNLIPGICLVDEIDAHMHVDLQYRALPELVRLFPKVQFIVSSHSPLFVLGMENAFGPDGITIIDMPSGTAVPAEAYAEFGRALQVLQDTKAFAAAIEAASAAPGKALVLLEGETDPIYLRTAVDLLGRQALLDKAEFEWVGARDPRGGQGFNTGKGALNHALSFLRAKPDLVKRQVILLYDNDANKPAEDYGQLHVRTMPSNPATTKVQDGIESLLHADSISDEMFDERKTERRRGGYTIDRGLNKMRLCTHLREKRDPADFAGFAAVLDMIEALVEPTVQEEQAPADAAAP